jgi:hypothetical protein
VGFKGRNIIANEEKRKQLSKEAECSLEYEETLYHGWEKHVPDTTAKPKSNPDTMELSPISDFLELPQTLISNTLSPMISGLLHFSPESQLSL